MNELQVVGPWVVALIAGGFAVYTAKIQHKGRPEHALIDQLQEEIASIRTEKAAELSAMKKDISDLKAEQKASKRRERIRDDYINKLRRHIEDGNPPPAPDWPEGLYD